MFSLLRFIYAFCRFISECNEIVKLQGYYCRKLVEDVLKFYLIPYNLKRDECNI